MNEETEAERISILPTLRSKQKSRGRKELPDYGQFWEGVYDGGDGVDGSCGEKRDMVKEVDETDF